MFKESKILLGTLIACSVWVIESGHHKTYQEKLIELRANPYATSVDYANAAKDEVKEYRKTHPYVEDNDFSHEDEAQMWGNK